ncbi:hypothetical protein ILT44_23565 [Microvirga sp. BT689]|uniref:tetratricopeptide repeat protein n=1 Tax=Microvirga arvi TaxID=2778731 RepID=UPI001951E1B1|nr:hypothetical protein [Microvirga arvi]MBM6583184.1 hypothetical protein [Microvirga arvi]
MVSHVRPHSSARVEPVPADELVVRFRAGRYRHAADLDFAPAQLEACAESLDERGHYDLLRLAAWGHSLRQEHAEALALQIKVFALRPDAEALRNIGVFARKAGDRWHAVDFLLRHHSRVPEDSGLYDILAHNCGHFGDLEAARRFGCRSLELKDAAHRVPQEPWNLPSVPPFNPGRGPSTNVISFSLFGTSPRYVRPLLLSAEARPHLYPLWTIRVYVDDTVSPDTIRALQAKNCQVIRVTNTGGIPGTFWRFFVADDPSVDRYIVRDADSIINVRERIAVDAWIASGLHFHVMRDFYTHSELILAGMWGGVRGALPPMQSMIRAWQRNRRDRVVYNDVTADQAFLRERIWPYLRRSALIHDSVFDHTDGADFPTLGTLPPWMHVGQDNSIFLQPRRPAPLETLSAMF